MRIRLVPALALLALAAGCSGRRAVLNAEVDEAQRGRLVAEVLERLEREYVFPEKAREAAQRLRARWTPAALAAASTRRAISERLTADLRAELHDKHLGVVPAAALPPGMLDAPDDPDAPPTAEMIDQARRSGFAIARVERLPGGIGLLQLDEFVPDSPETREAYAAALEKLAGSAAVILDLRRNHGGDGDAVLELVSHFVEPGIRILENRFKGRSKDSVTRAVAAPRFAAGVPVFVLTSRQTGSAAEECAYDFQGLRRGAVVGEVTAGAANHNQFVRVAGDFAFSNSVGTVKSPFTGGNWEGAGVQPDVAVAAADALERARALAAERIAPAR